MNISYRNITNSHKLVQCGDESLLSQKDFLDLVYKDYNNNLKRTKHYLLTKMLQTS